ncbi:MAG: VOC family protein [Anaerolineae bacterium]|nr:VOC family protein [Anaerolineae bacterium]
MKRVTGIGGIFFKVNDPQALGEWYSKHLGLELEEHSPMTTFSWREKDDPQAEGATVWALFPQQTEYFGDPGNTFMINYRVDDLDALVAALRQEGVTIHGEIQASEYGRFVWITDPEGNRIELWEAPDKA